MSDLVVHRSDGAHGDHRRPPPVYLCYDERLLRHHPVHWQPPAVYPTQDDVRIKAFPAEYVYENPERIRCVYEHLQSVFPPDTFLPLPCRLATRAEITAVHDKAHYDRLAATASMTAEELVEQSQLDSDLYWNQETFAAARLACGGLLNCVDAVCRLNATPNTDATPPAIHAVALIRPPGHHACQHREMGFCFLNSVAVAARYAIEQGHATKVLILDWDIHHGNGTQDLTYNDERILFVSMHRYTGSNVAKHFFPATGKPTETGRNATNVNLAWTQGHMGDVEYAAAFSELVLPIVVAFQPELVLISCGLDAARGDLIGDNSVSPLGFRALTHSVVRAVGTHTTPVVVALEGGYSMDALPICMEHVVRGLSAANDTSLDWDVENLPQAWASDSLEYAHQALAMYWDSNRRVAADNQPAIQPSAISNINQTVTALQKCSSRWNECGLTKLLKPPGPSAVSTRASRRLVKSSPNTFLPNGSNATPQPKASKVLAVSLAKDPVKETSLPAAKADENVDGGDGDALIAALQLLSLSNGK
jgi:acetoin utilization deacetylase AcuC-like enzyme